MQFKLTMQGSDQRVLAAIKAVRSAGTDPRLVLTNFGEYMKTIPRDAIEEQRDPVTGAAWPPPSPLTIANRARAGGAKSLFADGRLLGAWASATPKFTRDSVSVGVGKAVPYARIQHRGGTIHPTHAKNMAIPLGRPYARAGSAKRWMDQAKGKGWEPFVFVSSKGSKFIAYMKGARKATPPRAHNHTARPGKLTLAFLLVRSLRIKARPYLGFGVRQKEKFVLIAQTWVAYAVKKARG